MRLIKLAVLSFIILFLVVTIISLFIPPKITISKATNIAADNKTVYTYIENLSEWRQWHPALKDIPQNEVEILDSNKVKVRGTFINVIERKQEEIVTEMSSNNGRPIISGLKIIRHPQSDSSTLQWYMDFKLRWYPWEKFKSLFFENVYGVQMEEGLSNLKELSTKNRSSNN